MPQVSRCAWCEGAATSEREIGAEGSGARARICAALCVGVEVQGCAWWSVDDRARQRVKVRSHRAGRRR
jgi:hypothetical protein